MLYVFQVDIGMMITFDMDMVLESVSTLKQAIESKYHIPIDKQVLLVSGGECLREDLRVSNYSAAGTDTNPIFLFNKSNIEQQRNYGKMFTQQVQLHELQVDEQMKKIKHELAETAMLSPCYDTVVLRTEIAKQVNMLTREIQYSCECLIREQHLQYQGWTAVIANLEDLTVVFNEKVQNLRANYKGYLLKRDFFIDLIANFDKDLEILSTIQVHPSLLEDKVSMSLLDWISQKDSECSLRTMARQCDEAMQELNEQKLKDLDEEIDLIMLHVQNEETKKIKRIESRLFDLDKLLTNCKKFVADQELLTSSLIANQNSANVVKDASIFPDLCNCHQTQMQLMFNNFMHMVAIKKKFNASKMELAMNLHSRLRVIINCETELGETLWKITMYNEILRKLKRVLEVIEQVNLAPDIYRRAVTEISRRRKFTKSYMSWANSIAKQSARIYKEETEKRKEFSEKISSHFLKSIFVGLDDEMPEFATQAPKTFDENLPPVEEEKEELEKEEEQKEDLLDIEKGVFCIESAIDKSVKDASITDSSSLCKNEINKEEQKSEKQLTEKIEKSSIDMEVSVCKEQDERIEKLEKKLREEYELKLRFMEEMLRVKMEDKIALMREELVAKYETEKMKTTEQNKKKVIKTNEQMVEVNLLDGCDNKLNEKENREIKKEEK